MDVISKNIEVIFRNEKEGKVFYSIGMSTKNEDGTYKNDYGSVRFKNGVELKDKMTKIRIKSAWLKAYKGHLYIFINDFDVVDDSKKEENKSGLSGWKNAKDINIDESELPF